MVYINITESLKQKMIKLFSHKAKLNKETKEDLRRSKKEKKRCQKLYADWKDDEYNCGTLKYIWGIKSYDDLSETNKANFYTLNDLDIYFNRDNKLYMLSLETIYSFETVADRINYLNRLLDTFREYMVTNDLFDSNYDPFFLYRYNDGNIFAGNSITELYYKFKIFVTGYSNL